MTKNKKCIIIVAVCMVCAVGVTLFTRMGDSEPVLDRGNIQMKCSACGYSFTVSPQEYEEMLENKVQNVRSISGLIFECPHCSEAAAQEALKCPRCGNVFIPDWGREDDYPDRCPECGFSEIEQEQGKR